MKSFILNTEQNRYIKKKRIPQQQIISNTGVHMSGCEACDLSIHGGDFIFESQKLRISHSLH